MESLTPRQIVKELDRFIVGQAAAKRAVAVALRNRYRRLQLEPEARNEVAPKNMLMIGPTGVGKTEIARRMAQLIDAPFIKVEATKFTEVGYVGRDVESIVRDLMETSIAKMQERRTAEVRERATQAVTEKLVDLVLEPSKGPASAGATAVASRPPSPSSVRRQRKRIAEMLTAGQIEDRMVEMEIEPDEMYAPVMEFVGGLSPEEMSEAVQDFVQTVATSRKRLKNVSVREARRILIQEETNKLIDWDAVIEQATSSVEERGIVFVDELDKITSTGGDSQTGNDVSREGVQRDLLPIVEGTTVQTRYGPVKTDHILFIAAGAFHHAKPSDLIPELQGRFPIRVELGALSTEDFRRILTEPENALLRQYQLLMATEGVALEFTDDGVQEIATVAVSLNSRLENIGARRLFSVVERILDRTSFEGPDLAAQTIVIDRAFVQRELGDLVKNEDLGKYIL